MFQAPEVTPADQIPEFKWVAPDEEVRPALCAIRHVPLLWREACRPDPIAWFSGFTNQLNNDDDLCARK